MRELEINGQIFKARPLKRKEVKQIKADGFNMFKLEVEKADDAVDAIFDIAFTPEEIQQIDELDNADALKIFKAVLAETYGDPEEEKN